MLRQHGQQQDWCMIEIEGLDDFDRSMQCLYAWYENEIIDRGLRE